ncbi:hypothetical protein PUW24_07155 [Paenibacillus urinalis]|uniref:Uncharacterized protein n=1 Tax=Paenibacillus urinalis TaxID=521520 RepID=A0ABY7XCA9_9BACL|nr:hypothetical protein [Paenibacillus urinalis]WDH98688.1 hypothetical protein PUW24_07155 [Paenibacillus urinalis]WDI02381.1 hypothetical protein PUW25_24875 [Paenibacillus urinalis]
MDDIIAVPQPTVLKKAIDVLITNDALSGDQLILELSRHGLSLKQVRDRGLLGLQKGTLNNKNQGSPIEL